MLLFILLLLFVITYPVKPQLDYISPCPQVFIHEGKSQEPDKWYGVVTLHCDEDFTSTHVQLIFDRPSLELGNWLGEVETDDNIKYFVNNETNKVKAYIPQSFRFYVKYDPNETPPKLISIRFNARIICPEEELPEQDATPALMPEINSYTYSEIAEITSPRPIPEAVTTNQPTTAGESDAEDDFFGGDFDTYIAHFVEQASLDEDGDDLNNICGTVVRQATPLITHGFATEEGEFPWHAAMYHTTSVQTKYVCGGSLVSKLHIVTAAHCVTRQKTGKPIPAENLDIYLGKSVLRVFSSPNIQGRQVSKITPHPDYKAKSYSNDIAVLTLSAPVEITDYVRPICLWQDSTDLNLLMNKQGIVAGWGFDQTGKLSEKLMQANMPVVSHETCLFSYPDFYSRFSSNKTYCAGFKNGTSVCNGDSGSGMVFPSKTTDRPVFQLRGIVSLSVALQNQFICDTSHYVVFTDVAKYIDWIVKVINQK